MDKKLDQARKQLQSCEEKERKLQKELVKGPKEIALIQERLQLAVDAKNLAETEGEEWGRRGGKEGGEKERGRREEGGKGERGGGTVEGGERDRGRRGKGEGEWGVEGGAADRQKEVWRDALIQERLQQAVDTRTWLKLGGGCNE